MSINNRSSLQRPSRHRIQEMRVNIEVFDSDRMSDLALIYNEEAAQVPLSDPVTPERFAEASRFRKDEGTPRKVTAQTILAATEDGQPVGFAHLATGRFPGPELRGDQEPGDTGAIRYFAYPRSHRAVGQALLDATEEYFRSQNAGRILAFSNTTGYLFRRFSFGEVSDRRTHIVALFGMNGYETARGEVFLGSKDYVVKEPVPGEGTFDIDVRRFAEKPFLDGIVVTVRHGSEEVGLCEAHSHGKWGASTESNETLVVGPLDVEEPYQGKGWGRYLLLKTLQEARNIGYRHTVISTDWRNYRAQLFYSNYGYDALDTAYSFVKVLS